MDSFLVWEKLYTLQHAASRERLAAQIRCNNEVVDALYTKTCLSLLASYTVRKNLLYRYLDA